MPRLVPLPKKENTYIPHWQLLRFKCTPGHMRLMIKCDRFHIAKLSDKELENFIGLRIGLWTLTTVPEYMDTPAKEWERRQAQLTIRIQQIARHWVRLYRLSGNYYVLPNRYLSALMRSCRTRQIREHIYIPRLIN
jgi:hypothetical protein